MGVEHYTDPQGRSVRAKHVVRVKKKGKQIWLWDDGRSASRAHMLVSFQQRRQSIVGDCRQLKSDVDSFNDNRNDQKPIQMSFNSAIDLEELAMGA